jgi:hypothetical protein
MCLIDGQEHQPLAKGLTLQDMPMEILANGYLWTDEYCVRLFEISLEVVSD